MKKYLLLFLSVYAFSQPLYYYNNGKKIIVEESKERTYPVQFKIGDKLLFVKKSILLKLKPGVDAEEFFNENNVSNYQQIMRSMYKVYTSSEKEAISLSAKLFETGKVVFSQPNLKKEIHWR